MATLNLDDPRQQRVLAPVLAVGALALLILLIVALFRLAL